MQVKGVVSDRLLVQLLSTWLSPGSQQQQQAKPRRPTLIRTSFSPSKCCKARLGIAVKCAEDCAQQQMLQEQSTKGELPASAATRPPLQEITYIHAAIRSALESFATEAHSMQGSAEITANRLKALVEKHRFLRSVCTFHSASEDEVLLPAARWAGLLTVLKKKSLP